MKLLIANRGEIAIRVARAAAELEIPTVAVHAEDDGDSLHTRVADAAFQLNGAGPAAYLDGEQVIAVANANGCTAIHPGYGFLSENGQFAQRCAEEGIQFIGPRPELLGLFGDKVRAREAAIAAEVPVLQGTEGPTELAAMKAFAKSQEGCPIVIKALAGGGGRGIRVVRADDDLAEAFARCQSEALAAFGNGGVYGEAFVGRAKHIEVQVIGDGQGGIAHLGERDCSVQRKHQKILEIAPSPHLPPALRDAIVEAAIRLARSVKYGSLGTFEFLADVEAGGFFFIEANPRIQVEHTITEEVTDVDLVQTQLRLARGETLDQVGLGDDVASRMRGFAIQLRINAETMAADGSPVASGGAFTTFEPPSGPGLRCDGSAYAGYRINPRYDSLMAKLIVHSPAPDFRKAIARARRAIDEFRIQGVATNIDFHRAILDHPDLADGAIYTRWIDDQAARLAEAAASASRPRYFEDVDLGAAVTSAVAAEPPIPDGCVGVRAPSQGTVVTLSTAAGDAIREGQALLVVEAMKLETPIKAGKSGHLIALLVDVGDVISANQLLAIIEEADIGEAGDDLVESAAAAAIRSDLQELYDRRALTMDDARPEAVAKRHARGGRTARENVEDLCDPGSFAEYGQMVVAAQRSRKPLDELIAKTPADGVVCGIGSVNGADFDVPASRCAVMAYDYTVIAGTQGMNGHRKIDRMFNVAYEARLPVIFFAEGGGGRPGDVDFASGFDSPTFNLWARLSGHVPLVGINGGVCFAGNAGIIGMCDVVISTENSTIGMGGPAMIEGGGLGVYKASEVGPADMHWKNGVIDILVKDEAEATRAAKKYISYFQGRLRHWEDPDVTRLRSIVPGSRRQAYRMMDVIEGIADVGSVLELRGGFGVGIITAFIRIEGRPVGVIANNPMHLGGAIDSDGSDKGARFVQLCDAFDIPILSLIDNPGIMVGPEAEKTALIRHASRLFVTAASVTVPFMGVQIRKAYGLGGIAMAAGAYKTPLFYVVWPSAETGGMGIEAAVKLGYRAQMEAMEPEEAKAFYDKMVADLYAEGRAVNSASMFKFDEVIDPSETRWRIASMLDAVRRPAPRTTKKRPCVDTW